MYRTTDGGTTWTRVWDWTSYPNRSFRYTQDISANPWLTFGTNPQLPEVSPKLGWGGYTGAKAIGHAVVMGPNVLTPGSGAPVRPPRRWKTHWTDRASRRESHSPRSPITTSATGRLGRP